MSTTSAAVVGALVGGAACAAAAPYLARLTLSVPDAGVPDWWRAGPVERRRIGRTLRAALILGGLGGAAARWSALLPAFLFLALLGAPLAIIDWDEHRLPDRLMVPVAVGGAVLLTLAAAVQGEWGALARAGEAAAAVFAVLLALNLAAPGSFGMGDVKLGGVLGGYLGWFGWAQVFYGLFAGMVLGAAVSLFLLVRGRARMTTVIALGPMLLLGALLVLAWRAVPS